MPKTICFEDPLRERLIRELKKLSKKEKAKIWNKVALELEKSKRKRREVNLWKINKYSKDNDFVVIPGKVLAHGDFNHKINVAAFKFSDAAKEKIKSFGGNILTIEELAKKNPKGSNLKILC